MSIIIQNISPLDAGEGINRYQLRINSQVITEFDHVRSDGLAACLLAASKAAQFAAVDELVRISQELGFYDVH